MEKLRTIPECSHIYPLPRSLDELKSMCVKNRLIGEHLMLGAGLTMDGAPLRMVIGGDYGLVQLDAKTRNQVVRSGFIVDRDIMEITHTPQGARPEEMFDAERKRLRSREFRLHMIMKLVEIAKAMKLNKVRSIYSGDHYSLTIGLMKDDEAFYRLDQPFIKLGFQLVEVVDDGSSVCYWQMCI